MERQILKDMKKVDELIYSFTNVLCVDDNKNLKDYNDSEIIQEAQYIYDTYKEYDHRNYLMVCGEYGKEEQKQAVKEIKQLKNFLNKWRK